MTSTNIAELRNSLSRILDKVLAGEEIEIRRRNVPIARIVPLRPDEPNATRLGCGRGTVVVKTDLTDPVWSGDDWEMLTP